MRFLVSNMCGGNTEELKRRIYDALKDVMDPEIGLNVVDAGFIKNVLVDQEGNVTVEMILTTPFCPLAHIMISQVRRAVEKIPGVKSVDVKIVGFGIPEQLLRRLGYR